MPALRRGSAETGQRVFGKAANPCLGGPRRVNLARIGSSQIDFDSMPVSLRFARVFPQINWPSDGTQAVVPIRKLEVR
jgi:hypothetical protein